MENTIEINYMGADLKVSYSYEEYDAGDHFTPPCYGGVTSINRVLWCDGKKNVDVTALVECLLDDELEGLKEEICESLED